MTVKDVVAATGVTWIIHCWAQRFPKMGDTLEASKISHVYAFFRVKPMSQGYRL